MIGHYRLKEGLPLERGGFLRPLDISFSTFGTLNEKRDNVIWVCHALTANSDVQDWWPNTVVSGGFLDPSKWFIVCANILGSHYGTTGPLSQNPSTGKPYYTEFPHITIRDMVSVHIKLADKLGIKKIHAMIGSSLGGFQAMQWAVMQPDRIEKLVLIATDTSVSPWAAALNETQRMAIKADSTFGNESEDAGSQGLSAARAIALLSYRGPSGYNLSQRNEADTTPFSHRASTYQNYQGDKLCRRFDAYSYMSILDSFDSHDIGRGRGSADNALASIKAETLCVSIPTDILFPTEKMKEIARKIPNGRHVEITSDFGHDGFLVEHAQLNNLLLSFL